MCCPTPSSHRLAQSHAASLSVHKPERWNRKKKAVVSKQYTSREGRREEGKGRKVPLFAPNSRGLKECACERGGGGGGDLITFSSPCTRNDSQICPLPPCAPRARRPSVCSAERGGRPPPPCPRLMCWHVFEPSAAPGEAAYSRGLPSLSTRDQRTRSSPPLASTPNHQRQGLFLPLFCRLPFAVYFSSSLFSPVPPHHPAQYLYLVE